MRTEGFKGALLAILIIASLIALAMTLLFVNQASAAPEGLNPHNPIYIEGNDNFTAASSTNEESSRQLGQETRLGKLSGPLREQLERKAEDEWVRIIIRLEWADLEGIRGRENVVGALKGHANGTRKPVLEMLRGRGARVLNKFWIANAILAEVRVGTVYELASIPTICRIHEDYELRILEARERRTELLITTSGAQTGGSGDNVTWGLAKIQAPDVWAMGIRGDNIWVAVLDTGVDITHPDLENKMWTDNEDDNRYPGGWVEFNKNGKIVENSGPHDTHGHGTHVSGTVVGGDNSGKAIGVAPNAWLMHALVLPGGSGSLSQIWAGMQWAIQPHDKDNNPVGRPADVVSMSFGGAYQVNENIYIEAIRNLKSAGIVPVAAIGNDGKGTSIRPGSIYEAFGIGAVDRSNRVPVWSSGEIVYKTDWSSPPADWPSSWIKPDFAAPGEEVYSSLPENTWGFEDIWGYVSGTSMATPHVTGVVALMLNADNSLSVDDMYDILATTSEDFGEPGKDTRYGWGIVNAYDAVGMVLYNSGVQGYVVDSETSGGMPWAAKVTIEERDRWKYTYENGYYRIFSPPGSYSMIVSAFGYENENIAVEVVENQWTTENVALSPLPTGFIEGKVVDNDNNPIENATVALLGTPLSPASTDNLGNYNIEAPIGSYVIKASALGYIPAYESGVQVENQITTEVNFQLVPIKPAPLADSPWPKFGCDLLNTSRSPYLGAQENYFKWKSNAIDDPHYYPPLPSPSVGPDGSIYVGGFSGLYALNPDGSLKWFYPTGQILSSPAINSEGIIFVGTELGFAEKGELYALTPEGDVLWVFADEDKYPILTSPTIGPDGTIYFATYGGLDSSAGRFFALNPDGTIKWVYHSTTGWIISSPAVAPDGTIYFGTTAYATYNGFEVHLGRLYAFNENGGLKWPPFTLPEGDNGVWSAPAIGSDGTIYFGSMFSAYAINENGEFKWSFPLGDHSSPAIGPDGTIYFGTGGGILHAFNQEGQRLWVKDVDQDLFAFGFSPAIGSDGTLYVGTTKGRIHALTSNGMFKWTYICENVEYFSDPIIGSDGTIYFVNWDGGALWAIAGVISVGISPEYTSAKTGETLSYTVTVVNMGRVQDNYDLTVTDNTGWNPSVSPTSLTVPPKEDRTATLCVTVAEGALPDEESSITVTATSATSKVWSSDSCIARAEVTRRAEVLISPGHGEGLPGATISYHVTILNIGNVEDTYDLTVSDTDGWDLSISPASLALAPSQSGFATLSVTVPENATVGAKDNITVDATSQADPTVSASSSCTARRSEAAFWLENLYKVGLGVDFYPNEGSRLVVEFYTYEGDYQAESVVWTGSTPTHVAFLENVPHPQGLPVEKVRLLLVDEAGAEIATVDIYTVIKTYLIIRMSQIKGMWPYASPGPERTALIQEISGIKGQWPLAPS